MIIIPYNSGPVKQSIVAWSGKNLAKESCICYNYANISIHDGAVMKLISLRETPELLEVFISYFQKVWANPDSMAVYEDCMRNAVVSGSKLPQWYLLLEDAEPAKDHIIGCAGLITNDFISRMDLYPWLCALFIEPDFRGNNYGSLLIERCICDAAQLGYPSVYLATDHCGYYEHFGFTYLGTGYHPWGETSRIYSIKTDESGKKG